MVSHRQTLTIGSGSESPGPLWLRLGAGRGLRHISGEQEYVVPVLRPLVLPGGSAKSWIPTGMTLDELDSQELLELVEVDIRAVYSAEKPNTGPGCVSGLNGISNRLLLVSSFC